VAGAPQDTTVRLTVRFKVDSKVSCDITVRFTARQGAGSERLKDAERDSRVIFRERERERERERLVRELRET